MKYLALLIPMVLGCARTSLGLHASDASSPMAGGSGGNVVAPLASGGSSGDGGGGAGGVPLGTGGAASLAGAGGVGGAPATGGAVGTGGLTSDADGAAVFDANSHDAVIPDTDPPDMGLAGCTPLPVELLEEPKPNACQPIPNPACGPIVDVGAIVARYGACLVSWGVPPSQCAGWPSLADGQEFVVLTVEDCGYDVTIESLEACADRIQVKYLVQRTCSSCNGKRSAYRVLVLPRDARPVVAISQGIVVPMCPQP